MLPKHPVFQCVHHLRKRYWPFSRLDCDLINPDPPLIPIDMEGRQAVLGTIFLTVHSHCDIDLFDTVYSLSEFFNSVSFL